MKAKVKKTGDIINVIPMNGSWAVYLSDRVRYYGDEELDFEFQDWESFHREAAKDILAAIISGDKLHCPLSCEEASNVAIQYADTLIAKLKEK